MKNQLKSKAFLSVRNVIIALVAVFLTAGAVTAIVVSKNGGNGESQTSAGEAASISESVKSSESFNHDETESVNDTESRSETDVEKESNNESKSENESLSASEQESLSASERESEQTSEAHIHSFDRAIEEEKYFASEATCAQRARYYYSCECGEAGERTFEVGGFAEHTPVIDKGYAATCDDDGLTDGAHCSVCGAVITARKIIPAVGHNYESGICSVCEDVELTDNKYFTFTLLNDGGYSIGANLELKSSSLNGVKLPAAYNEQPVVSVAVDGFAGLSSLNIVLPETVKRIEPRAFLECANLEKINFPEGLEFIGEYSFFGCLGLENIEIPDSLIEMGVFAFNACENLKNLKFGRGLTKVSDYAFYGTSITSLVLTKEIQVIGESAFNSCKKLSSIQFNFEAKNLEIGKTAFGYCGALETLVLSDNIKKIGENAFKACTALKSVSIGNVETIEYDAFYKCENIEVVNTTNLSLWCNINFGSPQANPVYYAGGLTVNGKVLTELTIPSDVLNVGDWAFANCDSLQSVIISSRVQSVGDGVFLDCDNIIEVSLADGVQKIGNRAFENCDGLTTVVIPDSVTDIGSAFGYCKKLKNIKLSASLTEIYYSAFRNCVSLISIIMPEKITNICDEAFKGCSNLYAVFFLGSKLPACNYSYNEEFFATNKYFYSETSREGGNYWHYDADGNPVLWK